ncbi:MAG: beta-glucosidase [Thermomicrobiales bacterium]|nr:beta-glucosidase [Thermomicrobiales bacterium]
MRSTRSPPPIRRASMPPADAIFPPGFVWGAATSAYQIEGAVTADGRGESIWDVFSHIPGNIIDGSNGDFACDAYHRFRQDIALMRELGLTGYRFSIAWPRVFPRGFGALNPAGLDHYRRLVDILLEAGIAPLVTLYHWDLPRPLQSLGGWANRDTAARFGEFAHAVAVALGGEVHDWVTVNEPWVAAFLGNLLGAHAPGLRDLRVALAAAHHLLLAHAEGMSALRAEMAFGDRAGIALNLAPVEPLGDSNADAEAAHRFDGCLNRWFLDALFRGRYPDDMLAWYGDAVPEIRADDLARISTPMDLLGVNYYTRNVVRWQPGAQPVDAEVVVRPGVPVSGMGWAVDPEGLFEVLTRLHTDYTAPPMLVAENGAAYPDRLVDGVVDDPERERYLHEHLLRVHRAIETGVPVGGYYVWSLLDNFEWAYGYSQRFGLLYTDFATQDRIVKRSGHWYAGVTRANGVRG